MLSNAASRITLGDRLRLLHRERRFEVLRDRIGGMLEPATYRRMYEEVRRQPDFDVIEVGGATGAGSIAMAWALKDARRKGRLIVVEKCSGGSRALEGGYEANVELIHRHFREFGVARQIQLYPHKLGFAEGPDVLALVRTGQIAALVHDADGRIDRDFHFFWPRLVEGGFIFVDDYEDKYQIKTGKDGKPRYLGKKVITFRLLNQFTEWGLFEPVENVRGAVFGRKPPGADFARFDLGKCRKIAMEVKAHCRELSGLPPAGGDDDGGDEADPSD